MPTEELHLGRANVRVPVAQPALPTGSSTCAAAGRRGPAVRAVRRSHRAACERRCSPRDTSRSCPAPTGWPAAPSCTWPTSSTRRCHVGRGYPTAGSGERQQAAAERVPTAADKAVSGPSGHAPVDGHNGGAAESQPAGRVRQPATCRDGPEPAGRNRAGPPVGCPVSPRERPRPRSVAVRGKLAVTQTVLAAGCRPLCVCGSRSAAVYSATR